MDTALQAILSYQFILFCLALSACTYVITIIVNYCFSVKGYVAKKINWWSNLVLPILPVVLGCIGALLAKQYPYPSDIHSGSGRFAFGLCAGLLSGLVWRLAKAMLNAKIAALQPNVAPVELSNSNVESEHNVGVIPGENDNEAENK